MSKKDNLFISEYNDYYGAMLTAYQCSLIKRYYDDDMSLSEIGQELGISPQGVRDALKRAEKTLEAYEQKLGLVAKTNKMKALLQELYPLATSEQKKEIEQVVQLLDE